MIDLDSEVQELIPTQEKDLSQVKVHELRLIQEVGPNQEVETQVHIHFSTMEYDFLRLVIQGQEWQVWELKLTLKYCSNQVTK